VKRRSLVLFAVMAAMTAACSTSSGRSLDVQALLRADRTEDAASTAAASGEDAPAESETAAGEAAAGRAGPARTSAGGVTSDGAIAGVPGARTAVARHIPGGPGVTDKEIKIGFMVTANLQAAFAAIGAGGQPPDEIDLYRVLVEWVNAHGGIGGRKVVPVFAETDVYTNWQTQADQVCAKFADDERVAVGVSSVVGGHDGLATCMAGKGVPLVEQNHWLWDNPYWERLGKYLYMPSRMRPERSIPAGVATLAEGGYFEQGHRLGLVRFEGPVFERLSRNVMQPALAAHHANLVDEVAISSPGGASDLGGVGAQLSSAILRFRRQNVTHVMFLENAGILPFFWNHEASNQNYYPRLGLMTYDIPDTQAGQASARVLQNSLAAGWAPSLDTSVSDEKIAPPNPARDACVDIMKQAGVALDSFGFYHSAACDAVFFLKSTLDNAPALTADGMRAAAEGRGGSYVSPYTFPRTQLGPGRHDGATMIALLRYEESPCGCYRYISQARAVP
jgi:hypothetical protein